MKSATRLLGFSIITAVVLFSGCATSNVAKARTQPGAASSAVATDKAMRDDAEGEADVSRSKKSLKDRVIGIRSAKVGDVALSPRH